MYLLVVLGCQCKKCKVQNIFNCKTKRSLKSNRSFWIYKENDQTNNSNVLDVISQNNVDYREWTTCFLKPIYSISDRFLLILKDVIWFFSARFASLKLRSYHFWSLVTHSYKQTQYYYCYKIGYIYSNCNYVEKPCLKVLVLDHDSPHMLLYP